MENENDKRREFRINRIRFEIKERILEYQERMKTKDFSSNKLIYSLISHDNVNIDEVLDHFMTLFMAGIDTTGHLLGIALFYLEKYPLVKEKLKKEVFENYKQVCQ